MQTPPKISEIMEKLNTEERFLYPDTDAGRQMILDEYDRILSESSDNLDIAFSIRPKAKLEVQRIPGFKQKGMVSAFYSGSAMDGSRRNFMMSF